MRSCFTFFACRAVDSPGDIFFPELPVVDGTADYAGDGDLCAKVAATAATAAAVSGRGKVVGAGPRNGMGMDLLFGDTPISTRGVGGSIVPSGGCRPQNATGFAHCLPYLGATVPRHDHIVF